MATTSGAVWAIDIGDNSIKALHLSLSGESVEVIGFDNIQHGKVLSGSGVDPAERDELIALSLRQFIQQNDLGKDTVIVSVPSQNSFARFVNLPPVEKKKIPEIVRYEAAQQIPFDISEVQWDWQMMSEPDSEERKVGIFAIKGDIVTQALEHYSRENIRVSYVQMAPMALYNYILYDRPELLKSDTEAVVILNIGAENTDLVVCTKSTVWQRCITMGGNSFTRAIAETFKLNFEKAEKLKRTATMSKYARQILQAMKPVFADLGSEIQRSLGFYTNANPSTKLARIIAFGGGTKMRGLLKFIQQTLQIPIERPDSFKRLSLSPAVSAAKFHDSVSDFGIIYGLGLQALGLGKIESNLLPKRIARSMAWVAKAKSFNIAAGLLLLFSLLSLGRTLFDRANYEQKEKIRKQIDAVISVARDAESRLNTERSKGAQYESIIEKEFTPFQYRDVIPLLYQTILSVLPNEKNNPEQAELYQAFANNDVKSILQFPRKQRKQIFITNMSSYYTNNLETAVFPNVSATMETGRATSTITQHTTPQNPEPTYTGQTDMMPSEQTYSFGLPGLTSQTDQSGRAGFVVTIAGYSPFRSIGELMDPAGAGNDPNKWGVVTRLMHLDQIYDPNFPFELFKKTEIEHFKLYSGEVGWNVEMPTGIGITEAKKLAPGEAEDESVLIDPLTKEIINKVPQYDEDGRKKTNRAGNVIYETNDSWFILNLKLLWKDAPEQAENR
jgi:type IV pilus assembly protein PilM